MDSGVKPGLPGTPEVGIFEWGRREFSRMFQIIGDVGKFIQSSGFSNGCDFVPQGMMVSGHISECQTECSTGVLWVEARDAAKTSSNAQIRPPTTKN